MRGRRKYKDMKSSGRFIDNEELLAEIVKSQAEGKATERLWHLLQLIVQKIKYKPNFIGYPYDWIMETTMHCVSKLNNFDPKKSSNPFSYFMQVINIHFIHLINDYKWEKAEMWNYTCHHLVEQGASTNNLHNPYAEPVLIDGVRYATLPEAVEALGITRNNWKTWIRKGKIPYNHPYKEITWNGITIKKQPDKFIVKANGQEPRGFTTFGYAADAFGIVRQTAHNWIRQGRIPPQDGRVAHTIQYITNTETNTTIYSRDYLEELLGLTNETNPVI